MEYSSDTNGNRTRDLLAHCTTVYTVEDYQNTIHTALCKWTTQGYT